MSILIQGEADYQQIDSVVRVRRGHWISEAALWTMWKHVGELQANMECGFLGLHAECFITAVPTPSELWVLASEYAFEFVKNLNALETDSISDLSRSADTDIDFWTQSKKEMLGVRK